MNVVELVRRFGGSACDAILDDTCRIFTVPEVEGLLGYRFENGCVVVFGDPVCSVEDWPKLLSAFRTYCKEQRKRIIYAIVTERFKEWALVNGAKTAIAFGELAFLDPQNDPQNGAKGSLLRRKVRRASKEGVEVYEYVKPDPQLEKEMENLGEKWLKTRQGLQIYISHVRLFDDRLGKRWFYAVQNGRIIGTVVLNRLEKVEGWHLNHLMQTKEAPHGTSELLVTTVLDSVAREGCRYVSFGAVPTEHLGEIVGMPSLFRWCARMIFRSVCIIFRLGGRKKFWEKFQAEFAPAYLLFHDGLGISEIFALMRALNVSI